MDDLRETEYFLLQLAIFIVTPKHAKLEKFITPKEFGKKHNNIFQNFFFIDHHLFSSYHALNNMKKNRLFPSLF